MELSKAIGAALKEAREARGLTQEDFVGVSGRTYLSEIERGLKSPTLEKIDQLANRMGIHPLQLLVACYAKCDSVSALSGVQQALETSHQYRTHVSPERSEVRQTRRRRSS